MGGEKFGVLFIVRETRRIDVSGATLRSTTVPM